MSGAPAARPTRSPVAPDLRAEIEEFQSYEIELLQDRQYEEWLTLFTDDTHYWAPIVSRVERFPEMVATERERGRPARCRATMRRCVDA